MNRSQFQELREGDVVFGRLPSHDGWKSHPALIIDSSNGRKVAVLGSSQEPSGGICSLYLQSRHDLAATGLNRPTRFELSYALVFELTESMMSSLRKLGRLTSERLIELRARKCAAAQTVDRRMQRARSQDNRNRRNGASATSADPDAQKHARCA